MDLSAPTKDHSSAATIARNSPVANRALANSLKFSSARCLFPTALSVIFKLDAHASPSLRVRMPVASSAEA